MVHAMQIVTNRCMKGYKYNYESTAQLPAVPGALIAASGLGAAVCMWMQLGRRNGKHDVQG